MSSTRKVSRFFPRASRRLPGLNSTDCSLSSLVAISEPYPKFNGKALVRRSRHANSQPWNCLKEPDGFFRPWSSSKTVAGYDDPDEFQRRYRAELMFAGINLLESWDSLLQDPPLRKSSSIFEAAFSPLEQTQRVLAWLHRLPRPLEYTTAVSASVSMPRPPAKIEAYYLHGMDMHGKSDPSACLDLFETMQRMRMRIREPEMYGILKRLSVSLHRCDPITGRDFLELKVKKSSRATEQLCEIGWLTDKAADKDMFVVFLTASQRSPAELVGANLFGMDRDLPNPFAWIILKPDLAKEARKPDRFTVVKSGEADPESLA